MPFKTRLKIGRFQGCSLKVIGGGIEGKRVEERGVEISMFTSPSTYEGLALLLV
jgi:hypothetical protein